MASPKPVDNEGVIFFNSTCSASQQQQGPSHATDDFQLLNFTDGQSGRSSPVLIEPAEKEIAAPAEVAPHIPSTNNSAVIAESGGGDQTVIQNVSEMFSGVTGVLNLVVAELKSLKESTNSRVSASHSSAFGQHDRPLCIHWIPVVL